MRRSFARISLLTGPDFASEVLFLALGITSGCATSKYADDLGYDEYLSKVRTMGAGSTSVVRGPAVQLEIDVVPDQVLFPSEWRLESRLRPGGIEHVRLRLMLRYNQSGAEKRFTSSSLMGSSSELRVETSGPLPLGSRLPEDPSYAGSPAMGDGGAKMERLYIYLPVDELREAPQYGSLTISVSARFDQVRIRIPGRLIQAHLAATDRAVGGG